MTPWKVFLKVSSAQFRDGGKWKLCLRYSRMGHYSRPLALFSSQGRFALVCCFTFTHVTFPSASRLNLLHSGSCIWTTHHLVISLISLSICTPETAKSALWTNHLKIRGKPGWLQDHSKTNTYVKKKIWERSSTKFKKDQLKDRGFFSVFGKSSVLWIKKRHISNMQFLWFWSLLNVSLKSF